MKLSIVIPVYKVEQYLNRCVESILVSLKGKEKDYEIILVDDGSPDNCPAMCDEYAKKHQHIHVVHKTNGGLSDARNAGIKVIEGEYVTFIDSDDYVKEDFVRIFQYMKEFPSEDVLSFAFEREKDIYGPNILKKYDEVNGENIIFILENENVNTAWAKIIKSDVIIKNNLLFQGAVAEDLEWLIRLMLVAKSWVSCPYAFYVYFVNTSSITQQHYSVKMTKDAFSCFEKVFKTMNHSSLERKYKKRIKQLLTMYPYQYIFKLKSYSKIEQKELLKLFRKNKNVFVKPIDKKFRVIYFSIKLLGFKLTSELLALKQKLRGSKRK